jgi:hypothetical protein
MALCMYKSSVRQHQEVVEAQIFAFLLYSKKFKLPLDIRKYIVSFFDTRKTQNISFNKICSNDELTYIIKFTYHRGPFPVTSALQSMQNRLGWVITKKIKNNN